MFDWLFNLGKVTVFVDFTDCRTVKGLLIYRSDFWIGIYSPHGVITYYNVEFVKSIEYV